jgi:hypothetical protein
MTTDYKEYLTTWITDVLSQPQGLLNSFPTCPFAKKALVDNKVQFLKSDDYVADIDSLFNNWDEQYDVAVVVCPDDVDANKFVDDVKAINESALPRGFVCLEDHVGIPETLHHLSFNNGKFNIILCQRTEGLNEASRALARANYYINWPDELYDDVVRWRFESLSQAAE